MNSVFSTKLRVLAVKFESLARSSLSRRLLLGTREPDPFLWYQVSFFSDRKWPLVLYRKSWSGKGSAPDVPRETTRNRLCTALKLGTEDYTSSVQHIHPLSLVLILALWGEDSWRQSRQALEKRNKRNQTLAWVSPQQKYESLLRFVFSDPALPVYQYVMSFGPAYTLCWLWMEFDIQQSLRPFLVRAFLFKLET